MSARIQKSPVKHRPGILRTGFLLLGALMASSCMLQDSPDARDGNVAARGYATLTFNLEQNLPALFKTADTTFTLDSLLVVLSAPGAATIRYACPVAGRADTGAIAVPPLVFELASLRNWKARIYSVDVRENPAGRDTVHIDSVAFAVRPADTAVVLKTVSPAFSILRARFLSSNTDSILNNVLWLRLKVDGVVRDSIAIGGGNASLNWLQAMSGGTIHAAGDSGKILRSTNNGSTWAEYKVSGAPALASGHFLSANVGYVISRAGKIYRTDDGGGAWQPRAQTADSVNSLFFAASDAGFAVGRNGGIYKTMGGDVGWSWFLTHSNTSHRLNGVHFPSASVGYVVGENETILRTTSGTAGDAPPPGGVIWSPVAGGWFTQTNTSVPPLTTANFNDVKFANGDTGWAVGNNGTVRLTYNRGTTWQLRAISGVGSRTLNAIWILPGGYQSLFAVANGGEILKAAGEYDWQLQLGGASGTTQNLYDVRFAGTDTGYVVGAGGTIRRTTNGSTYSWPYVSWSAQTSPTGSTALRSVFPITSATVYIAGDNGTILKTVNAGGAWTAQSSSGENLNGIAFLNANTGWAVGNNGTIRKTVNGGTTWIGQTSNTTQHLRSIQIISADMAYVSGANGVILKTVDGGDTWYGQETPNTQQLNKVFFHGASRGFAVGNNGTILNAVNQGDNWTGGGVKRSLKGVYFTSVSTGWIVGADGIILKTTDSGSTWIEQRRQNGQTLYGVHFRSATLGWVTGESGLILKTTNGGTTWTPQASNASITLRWASFRNDTTGFVIGGTQSMLSTFNGGSSWSGTFVGIPGAKTFDQTLAYKYLRPNQSSTILMQAMDRDDPLRGYQATVVLSIGAGKDSTIVTPMARCGYGGPTCTP